MFSVIGPSHQTDVILGKWRSIGDRRAQVVDKSPGEDADRLSIPPKHQPVVLYPTWGVSYNRPD